MGEEGTQHLFFVFTPNGHFEYYELLAQREASEIVERLVRDHGGKIIDIVVDKLLTGDGWPLELS